MGYECFLSTEDVKTFYVHGDFQSLCSTNTVMLFMPSRNNFFKKIVLNMQKSLSLFDTRYLMVHVQKKDSIKRET